MKKKKKTDRPIFDSVRKPIAPPGHKISDNKPNEKAYPSQRKIKHKKSEQPED